MKSVGLKIRNIREQKNIKQSYIAGKLNIHTSTYCQIENGNIELTLTRLTEIIKILQIGYIDVLPDTPEVYIPPPPTTHRNSLIRISRLNLSFKVE